MQPNIDQAFSTKFASKRGGPRVPRNAKRVQHAVEAYNRTSAQAASPAGALRQAQQKLVGWPLRVEAPGGRADVIGKRRMRHRLFMDQCGQDQKHSPNRFASTLL